MTVRSIDDKYFILLAATGANSSHQRLWRGRIRGQVASELFPVYLCDIYPIDASELVVRSQTRLSLENLIQAWPYDDKEIWEIEFQAICSRLDAARREAEKAMKAQERAQRAMLRELAKNGAEIVVAAGDERELADD